MEDMEPNGGLSQSDRSRQAAANIARSKVVDAYNSAPSGGASGHLSSESIHVTREEWQRYHTAWQNYYQKYYNNYYSNAAKNYIEKEREKSDRLAAERIAAEKAKAEASTAKSTPLSHGPVLTETIESPENPTFSDYAKSLKVRIQKKASEKAAKTRTRKKLTPIFMGLAVMLVILFLQYNRLIFAPLAAYVSPGDAPASEISAIDPTVTGEAVSPEPVLIIPKLNIKVPVSFGISSDEVMSAMNNGVAHYRISGASAFPGEIGNTVITGHSAGDVYSANPYKYIFSGLERLSEGDLIYINYNSIRYTYRITKFETVEPTNVSALIYATNKPMLTLITCTPLGTSRFRLLVTAEQISPTFTESSSSEPVSEDIPVIEMPKSEPSFFERIWNWLTGNI